MTKDTKRIKKADQHRIRHSDPAMSWRRNPQQTLAIAIGDPEPPFDSYRMVVQDDGNLIFESAALVIPGLVRNLSSRR